MNRAICKAALPHSLLIALAAFTATAANAGDASNELTSCMVRNATPSERFDTALVTWIAASYHPSMPPELRVPAQAKQVAFRRVGKLVDRLLTEACTGEARKTISSEGQRGLAAALHGFWQAGTVELNQSQEATTAFSDIWAYMDGKKISRALNGK